MQFGVDPARAMVLSPVDGAVASFLDLLDGTRGTDTLVRDAAVLGLGPDRVRRLLAVLAEGGVLDDAAAHAALSAEVRHRSALLDRLRPDLAALSVVRPEPGAAAAVIRRRRASRVRVLGAGRVGAAVAAVLSAAGVGTVDLVDGGRVDPWDTAPGGIPAEHAGERRDAAGRGAVRRAAPEERRGSGRGATAGRQDWAQVGGPVGAPSYGWAGPPRPSDVGPGEVDRGDAGPGDAGPGGVGPGGVGPGGRSGGVSDGGAAGSGARVGAALTILAPRDGLHAYAPPEDEAWRLVADGTPHLYAGVLEAVGVVGPLVLPGRTACGRCLGLLLADRDPAWPRMLAQLRSGRRPAVPACDVALATTVAGMAASHALAFVDGQAPPGAGARLELSGVGLSARLLEVPADARCGCGAALPAVGPGPEARPGPGRDPVSGPEPGSRPGRGGGPGAGRGAARNPGRGGGEGREKAPSPSTARSDLAGSLAARSPGGGTMAM